MKIIGVKWFSSLTGSFGVVLGEDEVTKKKKAYIGTCGSGCLTEEDDIQRIKEKGAKFPAEIAEQLINS